MEIISYVDVETYLQNQQVYIRKEIANSDFKTIAKCSKVHNIGMVEVKRISENTIAFTIVIDGVETTMYEYKTDDEFFKWIKEVFIPVSQLITCFIKHHR